VESLRVAVDSRLTNNQSLKDRLVSLEALDESRRINAQHIEAIQWRRNIIFYKKYKKRTLRAVMLVLLHDAQKLDFLGKFDACGWGHI
jgi:hypothetical protein